MQQDDDKEGRYILSKTRVLRIDIVLSRQLGDTSMAIGMHTYHFPAGYPTVLQQMGVCFVCWM
jgi:hypothetical protein